MSLGIEDKVFHVFVRAPAGPDSRRAPGGPRAPAGRHQRPGESPRPRGEPRGGPTRAQGKLKYRKVIWAKSLHHFTLSPSLYNV